MRHHVRSKRKYTLAIFAALIVAGIVSKAVWPHDELLSELGQDITPACSAEIDWDQGFGFAPDGSLVAMRWKGNDYEIVKIDATGEARPLLQYPSSISRAVYSSVVGCWAKFDSDCSSVMWKLYGATGKPQLVRVDIASKRSSVLQFTGNSLLDFAWSPRERLWCYVESDGPHSSRLVRLTAADTMTPVRTDPLAGSFGAIEGFALDGKMVTLSSEILDNGRVLTAWDIKGKVPKPYPIELSPSVAGKLHYGVPSHVRGRLALFVETEVSPTLWQRIVGMFSRRRQWSNSVWIANADGTNVRLLGRADPNRERLSDVKWRRDGKALVIRIGERLRSVPVP